ncbi:MAG: apolipoprotein N-acyltransferase [Actinomycetota bacterium]
MSRLRLTRSPSKQTLAGLAAGGASGLLCFLAFPPIDLGALAYVALVPLAMYFPGAGRRQLALASAAFGLSFFGFLIYWIRLFGDHAYIGLVVVQTLWVVACLQVGRLVRDRVSASWAWLAFPTAYLVGEFARSYLPWGGFGWGALGYSQHNNWIALKLAPYTGVWGISLTVLLVNVVIAGTILRRTAWSAGALKPLTIALVLVIGPAILPGGAPDGQSARIAMIQANVPEGSFDPNEDDEEVVGNLVRLTNGLDPEGLSLVVWPEGSFDRDPFRDPDFLEAIEESVARVEAPFMIGALLGTREGGVRNTSLLFDAGGELAGIYTKQRLVPYGEFVPLRPVLQPWIRALDRIPVDLVAGRRSTVFAIAEGRFASVICYESVYPDLVRSMVREGARMLVVSNNFSSFDRSAASDQHIAFSQLRAAEHRMWVAHISISGKSAVVAPDGRVLERTGLFEEAVLTPQVRFATEITPYARLGDWVPYSALVFIVAVLVAGMRRRPSAVHTGGG